jgi:Tfp pilus assembly protein PilO
MRESVKTSLAVLFIVVLAGVFWFALLAPKRDSANELSERATAVSAEIASEQYQLTAAVTAKENFASNYRKLVLLGKAVPSEAATSSLLVQLQGIGTRAKTSFVSIVLGGEGGGESAEAAVPAEGESALELPLGAAVGAAGLPAMQYSLEFEGGFFEIADFINELDALVETKNEEVDAKGRLVTIDGFSLNPVKEASGSDHKLTAAFHVTTYVTPADQGLTAGATEAGPEASEAIESEVTP